MALPQEVLLTASSTESDVSVWDPLSGTRLGAFRSSASPKSGLVPVGRDHFAATQIHKSGGCVHFWAWHKGQVAFKSFPVEAVSPVISTTDGAYVMAGGASGRVYMWEVASGRLLRSWPAHYKPVSVLTLSDDDSLLISGGEDGLVNVWPLPRVLDGVEDGRVGGGGGGDNTAVTPLYAWAEHTLPVTGLCAGAGGPSAVLVSSSLDHTSKIWSLSQGQLLRSIVFPAGLQAVALEPGEYALYAGSLDGRIFVASLHSVGGDEGSQNEGTLVGHSQAVTALSFSSDGLFLASGSEDGTAKVWDVASRQALKSLSHGKGPVTNALFLPRPSNLLNTEPNKARGVGGRPPLQPANPLKKYPGVDPSVADTCPWEGPLVVLPERGLDDREGFENLGGFEKAGLSVLALDKQLLSIEQQGALATAEKELEKAKVDLRRAIKNAAAWRALHNELYKFCCEEIMEEEKEQQQKEPRQDQ